MPKQQRWREATVRAVIGGALQQKLPECGAKRLHGHRWQRHCDHGQRRQAASEAAIGDGHGAAPAEPGSDGQRAATGSWLYRASKAALIALKVK